MQHQKGIVRTSEIELGSRESRTLHFLSTLVGGFSAAADHSDVEPVWNTASSFTERVYPSSWEPQGIANQNLFLRNLSRSNWFASVLYEFLGNLPIYKRYLNFSLPIVTVWKEMWTINGKKKIRHLRQCFNKNSHKIWKAGPVFQLTPQKLELDSVNWSFVCWQ